MDIALVKPLTSPLPLSFARTRQKSAPAGKSLVGDQDVLPEPSETVAVCTVEENDVTGPEWPAFDTVNVGRCVTIPLFAGLLTFGVLTTIFGWMTNDRVGEA